MRGRFVMCRHCDIAIEYCPCTAPYFRRVDKDCQYCHGSMWVGMIRSAKGIIARIFEDFDKVGDYSTALGNGNMEAFRGRPETDGALTIPC